MTNDDMNEIRETVLANGGSYREAAEAVLVAVEAEHEKNAEVNK